MARDRPLLAPVSGADPPGLSLCIGAERKTSTGLSPGRQVARAWPGLQSRSGQSRCGRCRRAASRAGICLRTREPPRRNCQARAARDQGKRTVASDLLASVYGWFTEGFDTPVVREAKALLEQLSS
jgi:hypothetical protein